VSLANELRRPARKWQNTYLSSDEPALFREWLYMIHDPDNRWYLGQKYGISPISLFAGIYTYRYVLLFSKEVDTLYSSSIADLEDLRRFDAQNNVLDFIIRNEFLEDDLVRTLDACGIRLNDDHINLIYSSERTNPSSRQRQLTYYYDRDTAELVRTRDRFIVEKYGYSAPEID
jgi:hypothetical protein